MMQMATVWLGDDSVWPEVDPEWPGVGTEWLGVDPEWPVKGAALKEVMAQHGQRRCYSC